MWRIPSAPPGFFPLGKSLHGSEVMGAYFVSNVQFCEVSYEYRDRGARDWTFRAKRAKKIWGAWENRVVEKGAETLATKAMGQYLGTRAQPGDMPNRPKRPLLAS